MTVLTIICIFCVNLCKRQDVYSFLPHFYLLYQTTYIWMKGVEEVDDFFRLCHFPSQDECDKFSRDVFDIVKNFAVIVKILAEVFIFDRQMILSFNLLTRKILSIYSRPKIVFSHNAFDVKE